MDEQDTFEDAVDTSSVRSLTGRKSSTTVRPARALSSELDAVSDRSVSPGTKTTKPEVEEATEDVGSVEQSVEASQEVDGQRKSTRVSKRLSNTSLDIVNLDDEYAAQQKGTTRFPRCRDCSTGEHQNKLLI